MKKVIFSAIVVALCAAGLFAVASAQALEVPPRPSLASPIVDTTNTLSLEQIQQLSSQITQTRTQKDYQIGVLIVPSLGQDEYLEGYSLKVAREWGVGDKNKNNGILVLIVKNDRKARIEVGRGLEGDLTDVESGRIIRTTLAPAFRKSDYYGGISEGLRNITAQVEGRPEQDTSRSAASSSTGKANFPAEFLIFFLVIGANLLSWIASMFARTKSWWAGGVVGGGIGALAGLISGWALWSFGLIAGLIGLGLLLDYLVSRNYSKSGVAGENPAWWAGGPWIGGGGGSDGGGSFGGGDFGGGGASGDW